MSTVNASASAERINASSQYSTFHVGGLFFGIEVLRVQEVLRYQELTRVPVAPDGVEGLMNLRGQIVTALDLRRRLNIAPRPEGALPMNVVVRCDEGAVSLLVDEIGDVIEAPEESFESVPETMLADARALIDRVCKLPGKLMLVLNTDKVLQMENRVVDPVGDGYKSV